MVNNKGEIQAESTIAGQKYRVIETKRGAGNSVWMARDTIKNETNGNIKEMTRKEWYELFNKFNK